MIRSFFRTVLLWLALVEVSSAAAAGSSNTFKVAAYNVKNWLAMKRWENPSAPKPEDEKQAVVAILTNVQADVVGLEEVGGTNDLADLAQRLAASGLDYPHREWFEGADTNRHVALLSRFPIVKRDSRGDYSYSSGTNTLSIARGILDVTVRVNDQYSFRALVLHLKSKRQVEDGNEAHMRREEARLVRSHIGKILKHNPSLNLLAMGDFNDEAESEPIRTIIGTPPFALFDLKPVARDGQLYTHYWEAQNLTSRIDYLFASPGMHAEYVPSSARIADFTGWEVGSDHRAIHASFYAADGVEPVLVPLSKPDAQVSTSRQRTKEWWVIGIAVLLIILITIITVVRRISPALPHRDHPLRRS